MSTAMSVDVAVDTRSTLGRHSVDTRWIVGRYSVDSRSRCMSADIAFQVTDTSPTVGRQLADSWPILDRYLTDVSASNWPIPFTQKPTQKYIDEKMFLLLILFNLFFHNKLR